MNAVVIGYGSIGSRHANLLQELGCSVAAVTQRSDCPLVVYRSVSDALEREKPGYCVIATPTVQHQKALAELEASKFSGKVLVEKPLFERSLPLPESRFFSIHVGYHYRVHPLIQFFKEVAHAEEVVSVQCYVGQYLPEWRPGRDYSACYSANKTAGGGVLRDLSHELDYLNWVLGGWKSVAAVQGRFGELKIDSDDTCCALLEFQNCPAVTLQMNYLDRMCRRELVINTRTGTVFIDLVNGIKARDRASKDHVSIPKSEAYRALHRAILQGDTQGLCSLTQASEVMELIEAVERSSANRTWIQRC